MHAVACLTPVATLVTPVSEPSAPTGSIDWPQRGAQALLLLVCTALVLFLFPALYVVMLGPAVVQYVREFRPLVHK